MHYGAGFEGVSGGDGGVEGESKKSRKKHSVIESERREDDETGGWVGGLKRCVFGVKLAGRVFIVWSWCLW